MALRKGAPLDTHGGTRSGQTTAARRSGRAAGRGSRSWWPLLALAVVVLVGGALALLLPGASRPSGRLTAPRQLHDFGQVPINGGLITTQFPLTVEGETLVTELSSS